MPEVSRYVDTVSSHPASAANEKPAEEDISNGTISNWLIELIHYVTLSYLCIRNFINVI